jgi:Fe-S-cluster-containing dehydrogenase component
VTRLRLKIESDLCWGCKTCEVACKQENGAPTGVKLIEVWQDGPKRTGAASPEGAEAAPGASATTEPGLSFRYRMRYCRHCREPKCLEACHYDAIEKRRDGIVVIDESFCAGCEACVTACPFDAVTFDRPRRVAVKCNLCHHRIDEGLLPACADNVCLAHCISLYGAEVEGA